MSCKATILGGMDFCRYFYHAASGPPILAALGVLSHEPRLRLRNAARSTWLPDLPQTIVALFVLRGLGLQERNATRAEASRHGDMLFVRAQSDMLRENGPLQSLVLWFECARQRFTGARFIGKVCHCLSHCLYQPFANLEKSRESAWEPRDQSCDRHDNNNNKKA